jgi:epoxyqueuosine reductase
MQARQEISLPGSHTELLLHSCCAPCAADIMLALIDAGIKYSIYFYNPNIHPDKEYIMRKEENIRFAEKHNIPFIDADYDRDNWFTRIKGLEDEPERGLRCTACFDMRFEKTAEFAAANGFSLISSTLGISRWKDMNQINDCGLRAASRHEDMEYWAINWRKGGGSARMIEISKQEKFYQQEYCGCVYSLRDTNRWRLKQGRKRIKMGKQYYGAETALHNIPIEVE